MSNKLFTSKNEYLYLPSRKNPKVAIAVDNSVLTKNSFDLYNPFSTKAKLLKILVYFGFKYFNNLFKLIFRVTQKEQSQFLKYLENKLNQKLIASVYFATTSDKVVIQLQNNDAEVIGYLKFPLNEIGLKHLENEKKALDILSSNNLVERYILSDNFEKRPFLLLAKLDGEIGLVTKTHIIELLTRFKRDATYSLVEHPRILQLKNDLVTYGLVSYLPLIEHVCLKSSLNYSLVYEHGDFTPWNIIRVKNEYKPFDFEHFVEDGLEHLDLIKYYYQVGKLLKKKSGSKLVEFMMSNLDIPEFKLLYQIFLIKEIQRNAEEGEQYSFEIEMLKHLGE